MNLDKIYTVKSNAVRDMKKAIAKGELADTAEVVVVPTGYQVVLPYAPPPAPKPTPQVPALPGMTPLGLPEAKPTPLGVKAVAAPFVAEARAFVQNLDKPAPLGLPPGEGVRGFDPAKADALRNSNADVDKVPAYTEKKAPKATKVDCGLMLTVALLTAKVWREKGLRPQERVGVWVHFDAVHESDPPHTLTKGQLPASTGAARKRGLIETGWTNEVGLPGPRKIAVRLTAAGLDAGRVARKESV